MLQSCRPANGAKGSDRNGIGVLAGRCDRFGAVRAAPRLVRARLPHLRPARVRQCSPKLRVPGCARAMHSDCEQLSREALSVLVGASDRPHAVVARVVLDLREAELLHQRWDVHPEAAAEALLQAVPAAERV